MTRFLPALVAAALLLGCVRGVREAEPSPMRVIARQIDEIVSARKQGTITDQELIYLLAVQALRLRAAMLKAPGCDEPTHE